MIARTSRRAVLLGGTAAAAAAAAALVGAPAATGASAPPRPHRQAAGAGPLPRVEPLPGPVDRSAFLPQEQRYAPYLVTLAAMTNDIDDSDTELRGYQHGGWWRTPSEPFNARIAEHVGTFAWFLQADRAWNPYRGDSALAARLDAAIDYYLRLQHEDGSWPEYEPQERSRAATAFALGYLSKTLAHLREIDLLPERRTAITAALRSATQWFLDPDNDGVWTGEIVEFANQPAAGLAGAAKALSLDPDPGLQSLLRDRVQHFIDHAQSPAGFLYEPRGMDIAYNLNVTLTEFVELHAELGRPVMLPTIRRLADWLSYTVVPEPDGVGLVSFASGASRTPMNVLDAVPPDRQQRDLGSVFSAQAPALAVFYPSREDRAAQRSAWAAEATPVAPLDPGDTNPRIPANIPYGERFPTRGRRRAALRNLPAMRRRPFTELRLDPQDQHYLFVRRSAYYLAAFLGTRPNTVSRAGLGLLWHPEAGTFVHGAQSSDTECWATILAGGGTDGSSNLTPTYCAGDPRTASPVPPSAVSRIRGDLGVRWDTTSGNVTTDLLLTDDGLLRRTSTRIDASEQVPLVVRDGDRLIWSGGRQTEPGVASTSLATSLTIRRGTVSLCIDWGTESTATLTPTDRILFADGSRQAHVLRVPFGRSGSIRYTFA